MSEKQATGTESKIAEVLRHAEEGVLVTITGSIRSAQRRNHCNDEVYCILVKASTKEAFSKEILELIDNDFGDVSKICGLPLYEGCFAPLTEQQDLSEELAESYFEENQLFELFYDEGAATSYMPYFVYSADCFADYQAQYMQALLEAQEEREEQEFLRRQMR